MGTPFQIFYFSPEFLKQIVRNGLTVSVIYKHVPIKIKIETSNQNKRNLDL